MLTMFILIRFITRRKILLFTRINIDILPGRAWSKIESQGPILLCRRGGCSVAIDDTESGVLREILGQVFGRENYVSAVAVEVSPAGQNIRQNTPARSHDHFHVYAKNIDKMSMMLRGLTSEEERVYKECDEHGFFLWDNLRRRGGNSRPSDRPNQYFPLYVSLSKKGSSRISVGAIGRFRVAGAGNWQ